MGPNFKWPDSMPEHGREFVFWSLTDDVGTLEYDDKVALNHLYFFNCLDKGLFNEHKDDWVLIHNQKVKIWAEIYKPAVV